MYAEDNLRYFEHVYVIYMFQNQINCAHVMLHNQVILPKVKNPVNFEDIVRRPSDCLANERDKSETNYLSLERRTTK